MLYINTAARCLFVGLLMVTSHAMAITFEIIIPSYNNERWCIQNMRSAVMQKYDDFHITYIDDCSTDATGRLVDEFVETNNLNHLVTVIHNKERLGPLANRYHGIHACPDMTVAVILDGDDMLAHDEVLQHLNKIYSNSEVWITYGSFKFWPLDSRAPIGKPFPDNVIKRNDYRSHGYVPSHVRTYYAWLFKRISQDDFMHDGTWLPMAGDVAEMIPMLEMASERHAFVPEALYFYNETNSISHFKIDRSLQLKCKGIVRKKKRYGRLDAITLNPEG